MNKLKHFFKENWFLVLSLIYILSPIDLIPGDIATGIGLIDDIAVLGATGVYSFIKFLINEKKNRESNIKEAEIIK